MVKEEEEEAKEEREKEDGESCDIARALGKTDLRPSIHYPSVAGP